MFPKVGITEMSFFDNGISIPRSFENAGFEFDNDCDIIKTCINGESTVIDEEDRGYGINSSIQLVTEGNNGEILIVSRNGMYHSASEEKYLHLDERYKLDGTLISIRVSRNQVQNFYKYLSEKRNID